MEKKIEEEKKISVSEKLTALQIAQAMGGFDVMTMANEEEYLSALFIRAERDYWDGLIVKEILLLIKVLFLHNFVKTK